MENVAPPGYFYHAMVILLPSGVVRDRRIILFRRIGSSSGRITNSEDNNPWYRSTGVCGMKTARIITPEGSRNRRVLSHLLEHANMREEIHANRVTLAANSTAVYKPFAMTNQCRRFDTWS